MFCAVATVSKTKELKKKRDGAKRGLITSVLEAVSRASGSPFSVLERPAGSKTCTL